MNISLEFKPGILAELAWLLEKKVAGADLIAGTELGSVALAAVTSVASDIPYIIVRKKSKKYGTAKLIEGLDKLESLKDKHVLLIEDITTTGWQILEAARLLRSCGAEVRIVAVIDR